MKAIKFLLKFSFTILIGLALCMTFVNPPPTTKPSLSTISWRGGAPLLAGPLLAFSDCRELKIFGPVSTCQMVIPGIDEPIHFIGFGGKWYAHKTRSTTNN